MYHDLIKSFLIKVAGSTNKIYFFLISIFEQIFWNEQLLNLGGILNVLSAEVLTDSGWENTTTILPVGMYVTCMVPIGNDSYLIHGGIHTGTFYSSQTFIFNATQNTWSRGPDLAIGRYGNGCGNLPTNGKDSHISVIVAGGYAG